MKTTKSSDETDLLRWHAATEDPLKHFTLSSNKCDVVEKARAIARERGTEVLAVWLIDDNKSIADAYAEFERLRLETEKLKEQLAKMTSPKF